MDPCPGPDAWFALDADPALIGHLDRCTECRGVAAEIGRLGILGSEIGSADGLGVVPELVAPGTLLGRFEVRRAIGAGGMGVVLEAYDPKLERMVALKVVRKISDRTAEPLRERVLLEAQAMARVRHGNVIAVHDVFEIGDEHLIAMEHVDGPDLETWLAGTPTARERMTVVLGVAAGLAAAHAAGIVHRDVKPANILVANGEARVGDFGLAWLDHDTPSAHGTTGYVAPEVLGGATADHRADQYAFAVTAWRTLFDEWPSARRGRVARILARAMAEDPDARYPAMADVVTALRRRRRWWLAAVVLAIVVAVVTSVALRRDGARCALDTAVDAAWSKPARDA